MKYKAKASFLHGELGRVYEGQVIELKSLSGVRGLVEPYEKKVDEQIPLNKADANQQSALQAAQALPQTTVKKSASGGKKIKTAK